MRQRECEQTALTKAITMVGERAAMHGGKPFGQIQPEPKAITRSDLTRVVGRRPHLDKALENSLQIGRCKAYSGIAHRHADLLCSGVQTQRDQAVRGRELAGVFQHVGKDLSNAIGIPKARHWLGRDLGFKPRKGANRFTMARRLDQTPEQ